MEKDKTLYMIGNAHIDPVWMWRWQEGYQEIKATFRSVLDRMKEYEDFYFTGSSAAFYEWIEENEPEMFEEIKQRIFEGRWKIVGGWWIQPDCNIPGGESFVRQGLYAQHYFKEKFGVIAHTGYNVDSFGHNGMLPQILKKSGMENYVFMRPGRHEKALGEEVFRWHSIDGSEVLAYRIPFEYCTWPEEIESHISRCFDEIKDDDGISMCFYGVGNHGGGPTKKNIESIYKLNNNQKYPKLILATPDDYFLQVKNKFKYLQNVHGELLHHASGCYSVHSGVKMWNRKAENRLIIAEKMSVAAKILREKKYPLNRYTIAWKNVLFNQFHDILAGTSIEQAYEDAQESYGEALNIASKGINSALQAISWNIDIPMEDGMKPLVVFNPNVFAEKFEIEIETAEIGESVVLLDDKECQIAYQKVQSDASSNGRNRIVFIADMPSMGWKVYRFAIREDKKIFPDIKCTDIFAKNKWFSIEFDQETGYVTSLKKNSDNMEYFSDLAAIPTVIEDKSDTWSHGVRIFNKEKGRFIAESVKCVEKGPVKAVIRVISIYGHSKIIQDYNIYQDLDFINVKTRIDWHEKWSMLKFVFPMQLNYMRTTWEIPYGIANREPDGEEYPVQNFIDVEGTNPGFSTMVGGLTFLNDGKTSASIEKNKVALTVLRSPIYAHHEPFVPDKNQEYTYIDQGMQVFHYGLYPHDGKWEKANTIYRSRQFNEKPIAIFETYHQGELPMSKSLIKIDVSNILLTVVKEAEDLSGDLVFRFVETIGKKSKANLFIDGIENEIEINFEPFEIKTIKINKLGEIKETNLLEMC